MSEQTREEVDAKLAAAEARVDAKLVAIDGKIDRVGDQMTILLDAARRSEAASIRAEVAASTIKWNILFTALAVLGIIAAIWAIWVQGVEMVGTLLGAIQPKP